MAANDYYNSPTSTNRPNVDYNAPLPPTPPSPPGKASGGINSDRPVSPVMSPFADHSYPATSYGQGGDHHYPDEHHPGQPYHGGSSSDYYDGQVGGRDHQGSNPFADDIPLKTHISNTSSEHAHGHGHGHGHGRPMYNPEPGLGGADQLEAGPKRRRGRGNRLFKSKDRIPWFVYTMTVIQVSVFIGQIIRNGQFICQLALLGRPLLTAIQPS